MADRGTLYRCPTCNTRWRLNPPWEGMPQGSWQLADRDENPGACCDNARMDFVVCVDEEALH